MTPERWQQVKEVFDSAAERQGSERAAYLDRVCRGDEELRREVESLLASDEDQASFLERPAVSEVMQAMAAGNGQQQQQSATGRKVGRYEVLSLLGAGGMGEVYLARDTRIGRKVALKLLGPVAVESRARLSRFEQEALAASSLNHPNILTIHEVDEHDGAPFIASEYVEGVTLREHIIGRRLKIAEALDIAVQVAGALAAAHAAGIVHRDVKPENIMLRRDRIVKVLDFGLAKLAPAAIKQQGSDPEAATRPMVQTEPGVVMGTVAYMSPEQARGEAVDARTDIWSLGVVLYEMLAGRVPFEGATNSHIIVSILEKEPPPIIDHRSEAPPRELQRIVGKALRKDPEERYQNAKDLAGDLKDLKREIEIRIEQARSFAPPPPGGGSSSSSSGGPETAKVNAPAAVAAAAQVTAGGHARTDDGGAAHPASSAEYIVNEVRRHKRGAALVGLTALVFIAASGLYGLYYLVSSNHLKTTSPLQQMRITKLTNNGRAADAAISPDGKYTTYVVNDVGQQSLWLKHIPTGSTVQIVAPEKVQFQGVTFSPDNNYVYYNRWERGKYAAELYQVPVLGGAPKRIIIDIDGPAAFSPEGRRFAFIRNYTGKTSLMIANADGTGEQALLTRTSPNRFLQYPVNLSWSPDGKLIVCVAETEDAGHRKVTLVGADVTRGEEKSLTTEEWGFISGVAWLADSTGLVVAATGKEEPIMQLWHLSYPDGAARRITNDLNSYRSVSVTANSDSLVTVHADTQSNIFILPQGETGRATQITAGAHKLDGRFGVTWAPDGRLVYTSEVSGKRKLWVMSADGSNRGQLTSDDSHDYFPSMSPDGRHLVFIALHPGEGGRLLRVDADGTNPKHLASGPINSPPRFTPEGQWVVYASSRGPLDNVLLKVPVEGGEPVKITDYAVTPDVSPDGKLIVCRYFKDGHKFAVLPFEGGEPLKMFDWPPTFRQGSPLRWTPDGRAFAYVDNRGGSSNLWSQPIDGNPAVQLTDFKSEQIFSFDWSRDGKHLAVSRGPVSTDVVQISNFR